MSSPGSGVLVAPPSSEGIGRAGGGRFAEVGAAVDSSLSFFLSVAAIACWRASLSSIHPYRVGSAGLVSQLSVLWWLGAFLAGAAVVMELRRDHPRFAGMCVSLFALAMVLHGTLPATEPAPRFSTAYSVAGFSEYIGRTGHALPRLDVRMSWPAPFAAAGMAARAMGVSTLWFLRWCPLVLNLVYLIPLKSIANTCLRTPRAQWAVLGIFLVSNWIDQDYFSPQGLNLLLFLAAVAIVLRVFAIGGFPPRLVGRLCQTGLWYGLKRVSLRVLQLPYGALDYERPEEGTTGGYRVATLVVLLVICGASAVSHQITPAALCLVFFAFALLGRTSLRMLWLLVGVMVWAWLSWEGRSYWSNHLSKVFGSAGQVGSTLNSAVAARLQGASFGRELVQYGRLLTAAIVVLGAAYAFWALWRRGHILLTMAIVAIAPVAVAGAVSYGGEVALRVLLFGLAPAAVIIASLIDQPMVRKRAVVFCLVLSAVLLVLFPLDRYGNESFEAITPGDLAAAVWIHQHVATGAVILVPNKDEPLSFARDGDFRVETIGNLLTLQGQQLADAVPVTHKPTYVYLTQSENNDGVYYLGYPSDWLKGFAPRLVATGYAHVVFHSSTATVIRIEKAPRPRHRPIPTKPHPSPPHPLPGPSRCRPPGRSRRRPPGRSRRRRLDPSHRRAPRPRGRRARPPRPRPRPRPRPHPRPPRRPRPRPCPRLPPRRRRQPGFREWCDDPGPAEHQDDGQLRLGRPLRARFRPGALGEPQPPPPVRGCAGVGGGHGLGGHGLVRHHRCGLCRHDHARRRSVPPVLLRAVLPGDPLVASGGQHRTAPGRDHRADVRCRRP